MSGLAPLAPAQGLRAGVPANAQQPAATQIAEAVKPQGLKKGDQGKYHLKKQRRKPDDRYPYPTGNELNDVERIFHWCERGASSLAQRRVWWKMTKIEVDQAHDLMVKENPGSCAHRSPTGANSLVAPPQGPVGMVQPVDNIFDVGLGFGNPFPPQQQAFVLPVHGPRPPPQGPEFLPTQQSGIEHLAFSSPQIFMPIQQGPSGAGHSVGYPQDLFWGAQPPFPQHQETFGSFPQAPVGMPEHADFFQEQGLGDQNPPLQDLPVCMPVIEVPFGTSHGAEVLDAGPQQLDTAVFTSAPLPQGNALAPPSLTEPVGGEYAAFLGYDSLPSSSQDSPPVDLSCRFDWPEVSNSLGTDLTVPESPEGFQDEPSQSIFDMTGMAQEFVDGLVEGLTQDTDLNLSGMGTQFQNGAAGDLPADDGGVLADPESLDEFDMFLHDQYFPGQ